MLFATKVFNVFSTITRKLCPNLKPNVQGIKYLTSANIPKTQSCSKSRLLDQAYQKLNTTIFKQRKPLGPLRWQTIPPGKPSEMLFMGSRRTGPRHKLGGKRVQRSNRRKKEECTPCIHLEYTPPAKYDIKKKLKKTADEKERKKDKEKDGSSSCVCKGIDNYQIDENLNIDSPPRNMIFAKDRITVRRPPSCGSSQCGDGLMEKRKTCSRLIKPRIATDLLDRKPLKNYRDPKKKKKCQKTSTEELLLIAEPVVNRRIQL